MASGKFRDRVTIYKDASYDGNPLPDYSSAVLASSRAARVNDVGGQTTFRGEQIEEQITTIVELRELKGLSPEMLIEFGTRRLNIEFIRRVRYGCSPVELQVHCTELAGPV